MMECVNVLYKERRKQAENDTEPLKRELDRTNKISDNYMAALAKGTNPEVVNRYINEVDAKSIFLE